MAHVSVRLQLALAILAFLGLPLLPGPAAFLAVTLHGVGGAESIVAARILFLGLVVASYPIPSAMVIAFDRRRKSKLPILFVLFVMWGVLQTVLLPLGGCCTSLMWSDFFKFAGQVMGCATSPARVRLRFLCVARPANAGTTRHTARWYASARERRAEPARQARVIDPPESPGTGVQFATPPRARLVVSIVVLLIDGARQIAKVDLSHAEVTAHEKPGSASQ